ncbi:MAG: hypothetical protein AAF720_06115 [Pseudomonadota bacterium]
MRQAKPEQAIETQWKPITGEPLDVRPLPAGASIHYLGTEGVKLSFPAYRKKWLLWSVPLTLAFVFLIVIPAMTTLPLTSISGGYYGRNWFLTIFIGVLGITACYAMFRYVKTRIIVKAQPDRSEVKGVFLGKPMIFDTAHYSRMMEGHELQSGKEDGGNNPVLMTALKVGYGSWGEETPFGFSKKRGVEYILWMNDLIEPIVGGQKAQHASEEGHRQQAF